MAGKPKILMGNIEYNRELAAKVSEFQTMAAKKNSAIGDGLEGVVINLLTCNYSLYKANKEALLKLTKKSETVVGYIFRIIQGEPLDKILKDVQLTKSGKIRLSSDLQKRIELREAEEEEFNGAYENALRVYEDRHT